MVRERRKYIRVRCNVPVKYKVISEDADKQARGALAKDISAGGVRFMTDRFLAMQSTLLVELELPQVSKPVKFTAKPAWIREQSGAQQFELGTSFLEIADEDRNMIETFISKGMGPQ